MRRNIIAIALYIIFIIQIFCLSACIPNTKILTLVDHDGIMGITNSPVSIEVELSENLIDALRNDQLAMIEILENDKISEIEIPVQLDNSINNRKSLITFLMPKGEKGTRKFKFVETQLMNANNIKVSQGSEKKQYIFQEGDLKILQYNYQLVQEDDVVRPESEKETEIVYPIISGIYYDEYLKAHPELERNDSTRSSIYAVPRSDYIHPLYGLDEEILTSDWPDAAHPHHRGIFWAWPEVIYKTELGDIYALQRIFARPTGNIETVSGNVFAEIQAENLWMWEDNVPIVRENVTIRAYRSEKKSRVVDLTISLQAIEDSISIATRFTNSYGGLNIRMQTPKEQEISHFTDIPGSDTIRAWADFNGIFEGGNNKSGLMILQNKNNPQYPGEWIDYPTLSWVQPTFPTSETRFNLSKTEPLVLKYRLIVHSEGAPSQDLSMKIWDAYHKCVTANPSIY